MLRLLKRTLVRTTLALLFVALLVVLLQDFLIFPSAELKFQTVPIPTSRSLPAGISSHAVATVDGEILEVWEMAVEPKIHEDIAIIFHGNGGTVSDFIWYQNWLKAHGVKSYGFDYRGYGYSSGWPSEPGLYLDAQAVFDFVLKKEKIASEKVIPLGISLGGGPASYLASMIDPKSLVLIAPFTSLPEAVSDRPEYRLLKPFVAHTFPNKIYLSDLINTCVVLAHGKKDSIIPFHHALDLAEVLKLNKRFFPVFSEDADHNDIMDFLADRVWEKLESCLSAK